MNGEQQVVKEEVKNDGTDSAWMRRHLSDSVYLWACGEKANDEDDDTQLCDRLIGWLILFMQGFAYAMLIVVARVKSNSDAGGSADGDDESGYLLPSVTGAMYLLVASTAHDLRAGYSLLVDGRRVGHRAFGTGLLVVYGIMVSAAMTVLVSTSEDSASVVLNAVTVLVVADLDEKALKLLLTVPAKWRLFWAIESAGISFALALVAIYYMGDASPLLEGNNGILKTFPTWFLWVVNPTAVTLCSVVLSLAMQAVCNLLSEAREHVDEPSFGAIVSSVYDIIVAARNRAKERFRREPCFHVALAIWLGQAVAMWSTTVQRDNELPVAVYFNPSTSGSEHATLVITDNKLVLLYSNSLLVIGLAAKVFTVFLPRNERLGIAPAPLDSLGGGEPRDRRGAYEHSSVPSLLVGSGIGYWITTLLYVLGCSWHGGGCRWNDPPIVVTVISYAVVPSFFVASFFIVADVNVFGSSFGKLIKPVVDIMRDRRTIVFWIIASVFRDVVDVWIGFCHSLTSPLLYFL